MTLLDLLLVIAILIILIGVAIVAGNSARSRAYNTQALVCGEQIRKAQTLYYSEQQAFADGFAKLDPKMVAQCLLVIVTEVNASAGSYTYTVAHQRGNATYTIEDDRASVSLLAGDAVNGSGGNAGPPAVAWPSTPIPPGTGRINLVLYGSIPASTQWAVKDNPAAAWITCPASPCTLTTYSGAPVTLAGNVDTAFPGTATQLGRVLYQAQLTQPAPSSVAEQYAATWSQSVTPIIGQTVTVVVKADMPGGGLLVPFESGRTSTGSGSMGLYYARPPMASDPEQVQINAGLGLMNLAYSTSGGDCSTPAATLTTVKSGLNTCDESAQLVTVGGKQYRLLRGLRDALVPPTSCSSLFRIRNGGYFSDDTRYYCTATPPIRPVLGKWTVLDETATYQFDTVTVRLTPDSNINLDKLVATNQTLNLTARVRRSDGTMATFEVRGINTSRTTRAGNTLEYVVEFPRMAAGVPYTLSIQDQKAFYTSAGCSFQVNLTRDVVVGSVLNGTLNNYGSPASCS
ncbi:hypothetical protein [Deinococcus soli (ex Cha et al. 2016)]|uniref:Type II secretory pathway pseudopilin PulG n=2 Tax=Deinococcus soli (ex Cha et al. 2016) TaxID=1309411 RepID=A0AAE4BN56_9DEIO|nr:hypothetical protein [Deinococcus soli (ex Cha et al. 2016)]MDR6218794.1 type II secretory pathway pseudopilin PulG [Deinococcus soli (ex Cha et al. 2016)]MDR6328591.1 type II secretory pathway pseudopilin PulG [Deinococcus soli (ex Cha et al. 2016)]MDR6751922.1 type II secretory pathway pseudopilin PulG [Deinococcus soli (ex Cha et al. 2016)]